MENHEEDLKRAIAHARDRLFADLLVLTIGLAAETHPEELRQALVKVFDMSGVEDMIKRIMLLAQSAQHLAYEAKTRTRDFMADLDKMERRLDLLHRRLDESARMPGRCAPKNP